MDCGADVPSVEKDDEGETEACASMHKAGESDKQSVAIGGRDKQLEEKHSQSGTLGGPPENSESYARKVDDESSCQAGPHGDQKKSKGESGHTVKKLEESQKNKYEQTQEGESLMRKDKSKLRRRRNRSDCGSDITNSETSTNLNKAADALKSHGSEGHNPNTEERNPALPVENHYVPWHRQLGLSSDPTANAAANEYNPSLATPRTAPQSTSQHPSMSLYTKEAVFIHVSKTDKLPESPHVINPVLRVHTVDYATGRYWSNTTGNPQELR